VQKSLAASKEDAMTTTKGRPGTITQKALISPETNCLCEDNPDGNYATETRLPTRPSKGLLEEEDYNIPLQFVNRKS